MTAAANKKTDPRGLKRICLDCGTRFYDMNKRPIMCPDCGAEFTGEVKVKTRRSRGAAAVEEAQGQVAEKTAAEATSEDDEEDEAEDAEVVSLDDLENTETKGAQDDDELAVDLDGDDGDLDEIGVDDDLGDLEDLEPDAELDEDADADEEGKD